MRRQEMRPEKVLLSIGIVYRGRNKTPKRGYSALIKAITILYTYIAALYRYFLAFYLFSPDIFLYCMLIFYLYSLYTYLAYYT